MSSYDEESGAYSASASGAGNSEGTWFRSWGNDCCPSFQRTLMFILSTIFVVCAIYQASHIGSFQDTRIEAGRDSAHGRDPSRNTDGLAYMRSINVITEALANVTELAAVISIGAGIALLWHALKWNVASRHMANVVLFAAVGVQLVALGFMSKQSDNDEPGKGNFDSSIAPYKKDIDSAAIAGGSMAIVLSVFGGIMMLFVQLFSADYFSAEGQTNCCDNMGCGATNDCGFCAMCGCSGGRMLTLFLTALTLAVEIIRVVNWADVIDQNLKPSPTEYFRNHVGQALLDNYQNVLVFALAAPLVFLLHTWYWTENSQAGALIIGFVGIVNQAWSFSYSTKFLAAGKAEIFDSGSKVEEKDNDVRLVTIASIAVVSLVLNIVVWLAAWFFSDEFRRHDLADDSDEEEEEGCCERTFYWGTRTMARIIILVLVVLALCVYTVRAAVAAETVDNNFDVALTGKGTSYEGNKATQFLVAYTLFGAPMGFFIAFVGLMHVWFWNKVTSTAVAGGFAILFVADLAAAGFGFKQTEYKDEHKTKTPDDRYLTLESFAAISLVVSLTLVIVAVMFSCGYNKADRGSKRAGWEPRSSDVSDDEYTYATADESYE